ncbi:MAG: hypothetical protein NTW03_08835, partial [Verrucomicrobia bacterium]|nr:hypothetical protein [Verrucomicrobiota bacterium]
VKLQNLIMASPTNPCVTIMFSGLAGLGYTVQYRNDLNIGPWLPLTNVPPLGDNQTLRVQDRDAITNQQRFYRLITPMQH